MLFEAKPEIDIHEQSPIALAFVGDGVFEVLVRARLVERTRLVPNRLHAAAVKFVSAKGQYAALEVIAPLLDEAERAVVRRGKNSTKATVAKHATPQSTGRPRRWNPCLAGCTRESGRAHRRTVRCDLECAGARFRAAGGMKTKGLRRISQTIKRVWKTRRSLCIGPPGLFTLGVALAVRAVRAVLRVAGLSELRSWALLLLALQSWEELVLLLLALLEALLALFVLLEDLLLALRAFCVLFSIWSHLPC